LTHLSILCLIFESIGFLLIKLKVSMDSIKNLETFLVELKKSGKLSEEESKKVDELVESLKNVEKRDLVKSTILVAKILYNYFN